MGRLHIPLPALFYTGMISQNPDLFSSCSVLLQRAYGPLEFESEVMPWDITDYYQEEMGKPLFRKFLFFSRLIDPGMLPGIKAHTNGIEDQFTGEAPSGRKRRINLDPGYITEAKVVLASTKDFAHRIYIGQNIYAEVALKYSGKERCFTPLEHTYYDFRLDAYRSLFVRARDCLRKGLNRHQNADTDMLPGSSR